MTKILPIRTHPDKFLRNKTQDLSLDEIKKPETQSFIKDLVLTMKNKEGIGLAAIQVGVLKSIIAINTKDKTLVIINPKIANKSLLKSTSEEGCLSLPGIFGIVRRPKNIRVTGLSKDAEKINLKMKGLLARIAQHEIDHLNGALFIDHISSLKRALYKKKLQKMLKKA